MAFDISLAYTGREYPSFHNDVHVGDKNDCLEVYENHVDSEIIYIIFTIL
jgi:hypothetical protein